MKQSAPRRSLRGLFIGAALFIGLGLVTVFGVMFFMQESATNPNDAVAAGALMFAEQTVPLALDNRSPSDLRRTIAETRDVPLTLGTIVRIAPYYAEGTPRNASAPEFLRALGIEAPETLLRALGPDLFFGIHVVDENVPVLVLGVASYERAFAGMLEWEPTMNASLIPLFSALPSTVRLDDGTLEPRRFEDLVLRNYDVRALKDDSGTVQLYYSFLTRNMLVIAESAFSFQEILSRLRADRRI